MCGQIWAIPFPAMVNSAEVLGLVFSGGSFAALGEGSEFGFIAADEDRTSQLVLFGASGKMVQAVEGELPPPGISLGGYRIDHDRDGASSDDGQGGVDCRGGKAVERSEVPDNGVGLACSEGGFLRVKGHGWPGSDCIGCIGTVIEGDKI